MSLDTLPVYRGLRVPRVARWSAEHDITPAVYLRNSRLAYADPVLTRACTHQGALWRAWTIAPGKGEPRFSHLHPARQRRMMTRRICQVCGLSTVEEAATEGGHLFLTGAGEETGFRGPIEEGERTLHPPVHLACGWESVRHCRHLLDGYEAARVARPVPWGLYGILHAWSGGAVVPVDARAQIGHGDPRLALLLAGQAVTELNDVRPIDLRAEAARAGLAGAEAGR
ncbi:hypothetical protein [Streptomyces marianii]|uniref:Uncharacterized protein n=1 Tax=Streptomyces marianii TaxID=1817406 RepID=A0A5R9DTK1_9ACTN|nr:hypothetical protein [Streptomyces marianii]TLQ39446.1 hypothetical protein FEF34_39430 [Streptomyces marianii]